LIAAKFVLVVGTYAFVDWKDSRIVVVVESTLARVIVENRAVVI